VSNKISRPLYEQIITQIKTQIISGELKAGEALPSIRSLAKSLQISVLTVQKALIFFSQTVSLNNSKERMLCFCPKSGFLFGETAKEDSGTLQ